MRTARAKGVPRRNVVYRHALRNALIPVVTVVGFEVGVLMSGAAIVEIIFGLPGIGNLLLQAIFSRDYPLIQATTMLIAVIFIIFNLIVDLDLRLPRPEDRGRVTFRRRPVLAAEGVGEVAPMALSEAPRGRLAFLGKWNNPIGLVGAAIVSFNVFVAIFGPYIWRIDPDAQDAERLLPPSWAHPFGTDELGRDTLARVIHGAQVSLQVGAISVGIAFVAGLTIGLLAGYYRGVLDGVLMRLVDMMFALPALVLAIVIAGLLGPTRTNAMIAIGIVITPAFARVVRGAVLEVMGYPVHRVRRGRSAPRASGSCSATCCRTSARR